MNATVTWKGRLSFSGTSDSGFTLPLGADPKVGGDNDGFRPMELFAIGLAACTAMDVVSILQKKRQEVTGFEVETHIERAGQHPKVFTSAVLEYFVSGRDLQEEAVVRSIELSATRYCTAQAMFVQLIPIELKYHIYEEGEDGQRQLVKSGTYSPAEQEKVV